MNSDEKIKKIKEIMNDNEESVNPIIGPVYYGPQVSNLTEAGESLIKELLESGNLKNPLDGCTILVKIENSKAQVSVVYDGIVIFEFKPVDPEFSISTFEFPGVSILLKAGW
jgi:hypothetical protein